MRTSFTAGSVAQDGKFGKRHDEPGLDAFCAYSRGDRLRERPGKQDQVIASLFDDPVVVDDRNVLLGEAHAEVEGIQQLANVGYLVLRHSAPRSASPRSRPRTRPRTPRPPDLA
jgi:hypothetical protein